MSHGLLAEDQIFARIGVDGFTRLVRAFYARVPEDDILGAMYPPEDLAGAEGRLRGFLIYRFGGPTDYVDERGHPRLRMRHAPFAIDQRARDRWVQLMDRSLDETALPDEVTDLLRRFFHDTATFMMNRG